MTALIVVLLVLANAALTWTLGWWAVPLVALVAGGSWRHPRVARLVALSAALGWLALLLVDAAGGRLGELSRVLGGVFPVPGAALLLLTLLFPAAAAWSAAVVGARLGEWWRGRGARGVRDTLP